MVGPGTAVVTVETVEGSCTATCVINGSGGGEREEPVMAERPVSGVAKVETKPPQELETVEPTATTDTDNSVPKGRQQHLASREELAVFSSEGEEEQVGNPSSQVQVFELSVAEPLPPGTKQGFGSIYSVNFLILSSLWCG